MDRVDIGLASIGVTLLLIAIRMPIGIALAGVSFVGIGILTTPKAAWGIVSAIPYNFIATWEFSAVPMFLLMGYIAARTGVTAGLFQGTRASMMRMPWNRPAVTPVRAAMYPISRNIGTALNSQVAMKL